MSDYRRLISYIYEYEGNVKGKNIGFVKLETKNGQCRLSVNVKRVYVGGNAIGVYLLGIGGKKIFLGNMFVRNGNGEFRATVDAENVEGTGNPMSLYYGLAVHDVKNSWRSYQTIWDDVEIVEAAEVTGGETASEKVEVTDGETARKKAEVTDEETANEAVEAIGGEIAKEAVEVTGGELAGETVERVGEGENEEATDEMIVRGNKELNANIEANSARKKVDECGKTDLGMPFTAQDVLPGSDRSQEQLDVEAIVKELDREIIGSEAEPARKTKQSQTEWAEPERLGAESVPKAAEKGPEPKESSEKSIETMVISPELENPEVLRYLQETEQKPADPDALWQELRKQYPKIQPFDYDGGCEVLTIRPDDIGKLPRECWIYGNNSFMLHGYYNYRYIILVRLAQKDGTARYLLGVPGHYYSNEKYMATMFGFPNFVLSKKQPPNDGRFGYWYTDIKMR